jgi:hypothetical protein
MPVLRAKFLRGLFLALLPFSNFYEYWRKTCSSAFDPPLRRFPMPATAMITAESSANDPNTNTTVKTNAAIMQTNNVNMVGFSSLKRR